MAVVAELFCLSVVMHVSCFMTHG